MKRQGVNRLNVLAVIQIVRSIDAIYEDDAGLGSVECRTYDSVPKAAGADRVVDRPVEAQIP
jgi:hypothetical protein